MQNAVGGDQTNEATTNRRSASCSPSHDRSGSEGHPFRSCGHRDERERSGPRLAVRRAAAVHPHDTTTHRQEQLRAPDGRRRGPRGTRPHGGARWVRDFLRRVSRAVPLLALERSSGVRTARIPHPGTTVVDDLMVDPDTVPPTVWTDGDIRTPMTRQFSLGVQQIPGDVMILVDGLFVQGRDLLLQRELNPLNPDNSPRYPGFASILQVLSAGRAAAKLLLLEARKSFPRGWVTIGYTLADRKTTNDAWGGRFSQVPQTDPDSLNLDREWGPRHGTSAAAWWPRERSRSRQASILSERPCTRRRDRSRPSRATTTTGTSIGSTTVPRVRPAMRDGARITFGQTSALPGTRRRGTARGSHSHSGSTTCSTPRTGSRRRCRPSSARRTSDGGTPPFPGDRRAQRSGLSSASRYVRLTRSRSPLVRMAR